MDVASNSAIWMTLEDGTKQEITRPLYVSSRGMKVERLKDRRPVVVEPMVALARKNEDVWASLSPEDWTTDILTGPNITDKDTILTFAQMTANSYEEEPQSGAWKDVNGGFNQSLDFGWENDGIRGHIYMNEDHSILVIAIKGTSRAIWNGKETEKNDKENDNLFFGCCCGQGSVFYHHVCDCQTGAYTCNTNCVQESLRDEDRYYTAIRHLYSNVTALYPNTDVWITGHSLGGALSAMLGLLYGHPAITFEAVPDALPAGRLGLPAPPGTNPRALQTRANTGVYHFGISSDPIYLGTCNGATASCSLAGYSLESACHTGMECVYDVVKDLGWRVWIGTHAIEKVIDGVLKKYDTVPECKFKPECQDCPLWKESNERHITKPISSTSTESLTRTRTATCQTPGWWKCRDRNTTAARSTSSRTVTTTAKNSSCLTPGWFGCKDSEAPMSETTHRPTSTTSHVAARATTRSLNLDL